MNMQGTRGVEKSLTGRPTHTITRPALCATPSQYAVAGAMLLLLNHIVPWVAGKAPPFLGNLSLIHI